MPLVDLKLVLEEAKKKKYAVGAFNVVDLTFLEAILEAAEESRSPVILNIAEVHFPFVSLQSIVPSILALVEKSRVPVVLNLDHGLTDKAISSALDFGFSSIMFDGSKLTFEENRNKTREVVERCHARGVSVEAELGAVGGDEGGALASAADPSQYTPLDQVGPFVRETGVDALAVAIGNSHGAYKGPPRLDFDRLRKIRDSAGIPLVLHGGSGISDEDFRKAISLGITKINFYTGMSQAALKAVENYLTRGETGYNDYPLLKKAIKTAVKKKVIEQMILFGSCAEVSRF